MGHLLSHHHLRRVMNMYSTNRSRVTHRYYFASLGALHDFADELIDFAFERQCLCDPARRPYYFECLQLISEARNTDHLQMKVAMLASQDFVSRRDLFAAYRLLNVPVTDANAIDDARILELFQVRQADLGPRAQEDARQALNKIGTARGSVRLINASRQTIESYDDALTWLGNGVNRETTDEALLAVVGIKVSLALRCCGTVEVVHAPLFYSGRDGAMTLE